MLVTFFVLKLDRSSAVRAMQCMNIMLMLVTFAVLKFDRSSEVKEVQAKNISVISVTSDVLRFSQPVIFFKALQSPNQQRVVVGR